MIFRNDLMSQPAGYLAVHELGRDCDPVLLAQPDFTAKLVADAHEALGLAWSYGGWLEDRSHLWAETYLKETAHWLHLGIDVNAPAGTEVLALLSGEMVYVGTDSPLVGGWGHHVIQKVEYRGKTHALMYAHLAAPLATAGTHIEAGTPIGAIGTKDVNGYWFPHVHVQLFADVGTVTDWAAFSQGVDGYGPLSEKAALARKHPDPTGLLFA